MIFLIKYFDRPKAEGRVYVLNESHIIIEPCLFQNQSQL